MADGNRTTLLVAVAGIAATALVGLAGTTAAWLSARDDRATQRTLARDERTYERRVAVYLDAIDFVEGQRKSLDLYSVGPTAQSKRKTDLYSAGPTFQSKRKTPFQWDPPSRLSSRLRAFGSPRVFDAFQKTESLIQNMPLTVEVDEDVNVTRLRGKRPDLATPFHLSVAPKASKGGKSTDYIVGTPWVYSRNPLFLPYLDESFEQTYDAFNSQVVRFETTVHDEVG